MITVEWLTLDFDQESASQNSNVISGQTSQDVMVEINKLFGKGVINTLSMKKENLSHQFSFVLNLMEPED